MVGLVSPGTDNDLAVQLIEGHEVTSEVYCALADRYVIAVLKLAGARLERLSCCLARPGVLLTCRDGAGVALLPDLDAEQTRSAIGRLGACLPGEGWVAVAQRPACEIADGYREAVDTAQLLEAGRRPGGTYRMADVLVEYAATRERAVADRLVAMIRPLREHPVLWDTLMALIDADHNRNQAAKRLFVHRSTLEYRLRRVAEITGVDPMTGRGAQQLTIALIAESIYTD